MIIDDVDGKLPFLSGIFEAVGAQERSFFKLIISYVARIYMNKGENMSVFLLDVIEYIKYAYKRYMHDYCLH